MDFSYIQNKYIRFLVASMFLVMVVLLVIFETYIPLKEFGISYLETTIVLVIFVLAVDRLRLLAEAAAREPIYKRLLTKVIRFVYTNR